LALKARNNPFATNDAGVVAEQQRRQEEQEQEPPPEPLPWQAPNYVAGAVWIALVVFATQFAPGVANSDADTAMLTTLVSQPFPRPEGINQLWFLVWNCFSVVPAVLATLEAPKRGQNPRLPAAPFLWGSVFFGYFALGPYFATRSYDTTTTSSATGANHKDDTGWASRNLFENRLFGVALSALALSIPVSSGLFEPGFDGAATAAGLAELVSTSRFASVALADITIMSLLAAVLVSEDAKQRGYGPQSSNSWLVASVLLPVITPCLYLVARPALPEDIVD